MNRRRVGVLVGLVGIGAVVGLFRVFAPAHYDASVASLQDSLSVVPDEVLIGVAALFVLAIWIATMMLLAKVLYWCWKRIDQYVWKVWDLVLPESPLVRFAVGTMIMIGLFALGPLVVIQALDLTGSGDSDPINETINQSAETDEDDPEQDENGLDDEFVNNSTTDRLGLVGAAGFDPPGVFSRHV